MRMLITVLLAITALSVPMDSASARGNQRFTIDQQWKRVQAWKKHQDQHFKAIESDAAKMLKRMEKPNSGSELTPIGK